jgi:uncharacterized protein YgiM (DUF1202 family)
MEKKDKVLLPRVEIMIIGVFFLMFLIWAVSRCSSTRRQLAREAEQQAQEQAEYEANLLEKQRADSLKTATPTAPPPTPRAMGETYTPLYITIDGMNVRSAPSLNSNILERLQLFDEVQFLNEVTDFREEVTIGEEVLNDPWVKIRTKKGKEGWVYGAGVNYYKTKRQISE